MTFILHLVPSIYPKRFCINKNSYLYMYACMYVFNIVQNCEKNINRQKKNSLPSWNFHSSGGKKKINTKHI